MKNRSKITIPEVVLVGLTLAVIGSLVVTASTSSAAYSPYNADWDGTTEVRTMAESSGAQVELAHETTTYSSVPPSETVAIVLSPDSPYRSQELARMTDFVRSGGTLVVADDFGPHANDLLRALDASARIDGRPVRDVRSNYRTSAMPIATPVADHPLVAGVDSLTLNYGTAIEPDEATPLVNTTDSAYLDADYDGTLGENETLGNYTVATVEDVGNGRVVVVGDSSAFINAMLDRPGNRQFVRALLAGHGHLVLDYSHTGTLPPVALAILIVRKSAALQFGLGVLAVGALTVWSRPVLLSNLPPNLLGSVPRPWREESSPPDVRASPSELADYLERRHPDWDRERVDRVVSTVERRRNR